jgi:SAM-dependent methyltransferase
MSRNPQEWDDRYAAAAAECGGTVWTPGPNRALAAAVEQELADVVPGTCVDVAAGEGRHAVWLAARGWRVQAVDFSRVGLDRAREAAAGAGVDVQTVCADVTEWDPAEPVDLVVCAFLHLPSVTTRPLLHRLGTWVAPSGWLVLLGHDAANLLHGTGGPQDADVLWDTDLLREAAAGAGLEVLRADQVRREVTNAERAAIDVLLVARRN